MAKKAAAPTIRAKVTEPTVYMVNPGGAVHEVTRSHARARMRADRRYRLATDREIAELGERQGMQRFDDPIAPPWSDAAFEADLDEAVEAGANE